jgi:hypothetical protein
MSLYFVRFSLPSPLVSPQKACSPNADPYSLSPPHGLIQMPAILLPDQQKSITDQSQQVTDLLVSEAKTWSEEKTKLESRKNEVSLALPSPPPTTPHKLAIRLPPSNMIPTSVSLSLSLSLSSPNQLESKLSTLTSDLSSLRHQKAELDASSASAPPPSLNNGFDRSTSVASSSAPANGAASTNGNGASAMDVVGVVDQPHAAAAASDAADAAPGGGDGGVTMDLEGDEALEY